MTDDELIEEARRWVDQLDRDAFYARGPAQRDALLKQRNILGALLLGETAPPRRSPLNEANEAAAVEVLGKIIWDTSRMDEGSISYTGANIIAKAILAHYSVPEEPDWGLLNQIRLAWIDSGPRPRYHFRAQERLRREWPTLARLLESLAHTSTEGSRR